MPIRVRLYDDWRRIDEHVFTYWDIAQAYIQAALESGEADEVGIKVLNGTEGE